MEDVKNVGIMMIDGFILGCFSYLDIKSREIPLLLMLGGAIYWLQPILKDGRADGYGLFWGVTLILVSMFSGQAIGLADSFTFFFLGLKYGGSYLFSLSMFSLILLLLFEGGTILLRKKKHESLPFLPFMTMAHIMLI